MRNQKPAKKLQKVVNSNDQDSSTAAKPEFSVSKNLLITADKDFVLDKLTTDAGKREKLQAGQIFTDTDKNSSEIEFLRKKEKNKEIAFAFPLVSDVRNIKR